MKAKVIQVMLGSPADFLRHLDFATVDNLLFHSGRKDLSVDLHDAYLSSLPAKVSSPISLLPSNILPLEALNAHDNLASASDLFALL